MVKLKKDFVELMNRWVAFRWGLNCIVYVLYYDSSILEPWVELNAKLNGWDSAEKDEFKKSVEKALKFGESTAFLITIENLGKEPINLSPLSDKVFLEDSKGRRYKVSSYEPQLDSPITGKVQGLVFFPLIPEDAGKIVFKIEGLPDGEAMLSWELGRQKAIEVAKEDKRELTWEQIVGSGSKGDKGKESNSPEKVAIKVVKPESPSTSKPSKPQLSKPSGGTSSPPSKEEKGEAPKTSEQGIVPEIKASAEEVKAMDVPKVEKSPSDTIAEYLSAWKAKDYDKMYVLLSSDSKAKVSLSDFKKLVEERLPSWLKSGDCKMLPPKEKGGEANISFVSTVKLGFIRLLETYTFTLVLEKEGWRVIF